MNSLRQVVNTARPQVRSMSTNHWQRASMGDIVKQETFKFDMWPLWGSLGVAFFALGVNTSCPSDEAKAASPYYQKWFAKKEGGGH